VEPAGLVVETRRLIGTPNPHVPDYRDSVERINKVLRATRGILSSERELAGLREEPTEDGEDGAA